MRRIDFYVNFCTREVVTSGGRRV